MSIKFYPEDQQDSGTLGILFPMNGNVKGSSGGFFNMSRTTEEQAVTNYINLLLTRKGERYFLPDFGIGLQLFIFEQNTPAIRMEIEHEIRTQSAYWLPYIHHKSIEILDKAAPIASSADPENGIEIVLTFSVTEQGANKQIRIFNEGGRVSTSIE